jgi:hypothetical protein
MYDKLSFAVASFVITLAGPLVLAREIEAPQFDARIIAALDTEYQAAVERNDWQTMDRILHPGFTLVLGDGRVVSRAELIASARERHVEYDRQVEERGTQIVRLYGKHTATVTALLLLKGVRRKDGSAFEYKLWFTDTYVRTAQGWRYAFGQASTRS